MANAGGMLKESIWRDADWRALSRTAQATYGQLLSQKELDRAGILPLQPTKWVKGCDAMSMDDLQADLKELEAARFVFIDDDTDELFIRSYMRHSGVVKQPNVLKSAMRCATLVASERLRHQLAVELRSLRRKDAETVADEIDPGAPTEPQRNPTTTIPEPHANPSATLPEGLNPSETPTEPPGTGTGTGEVTFRSGQVGGSRARDVTDETEPSRLSDDPPPPRCPRHLNDPTEVPCRACGGAREARADWDRQHDRVVAEAQVAERRRQAEVTRAERDLCDLCNDDGYRNGRVCSHDPGEDERNAKGVRAAREALARAQASRA